VFGRWFSSYRTYNWLMVKSLDLQGDDPRGPWSPPDENKENGSSPRQVVSK
jgi:hypothetical protein